MTRDKLARHSRTTQLVTVSLCGILVTWGSRAGGQSQAPSDGIVPTFRSEAQYVEVDAMVRDEQGAFIPDLAKDDFQLFEDGKLQTIEKVTAINLRTAVPVTESIDASGDSGAAPPPQPVTQIGRVFVMVLDSGRDVIVKSIARQFIRDLSASDMLAVVLVGQPASESQGLTSDKERLLASVDRYRTKNEPSKQSYRTVKDVAVNLSAVTGRRKSILLISEGSDLWARRDDIHDWWKEVDDATRTAAHYNVPIHTISTMRMEGVDIDIEQLESPPPEVLVNIDKPDKVKENNQRSALRLIAEDTGGIDIVNTNNFRGNLARIIDQNSAYYVIGYYSSAPRDGQFHPIEVRVKRSALTVRARKGFRAKAPPVRAASVPLPAGLSSAARDALRGAAKGELPVTLSAHGFRGDRFNGSIVVDAHVAGSVLHLDDDSRLEFTAVALDPDGRVCAFERRAFTLRPNEATRARIARTGVRLFTRFSLPRGEYEVRVVVHQPIGRTGTSSVPVEIPDFTDVTLAFSDIVVGRKAQDTPLILLADDQLRAAMQGSPDHRQSFSTGETIDVFSEIYDSHYLLTPSLGVTSTVVNASGDVVNRQEQVIRSVDGGRAFYRGRVSLAGLPAGKYVLTLDAFTEGIVPASASQQWPFEIQAAGLP